MRHGLILGLRYDHNKKLIELLGYSISDNKSKTSIILLSVSVVDGILMCVTIIPLLDFVRLRSRVRESVTYYPGRRIDSKLKLRIWFPVRRFRLPLGTSTSFFLDMSKVFGVHRRSGTGYQRSQYVSPPSGCKI